MPYRVKIIPSFLFVENPPFGLLGFLWINMRYPSRLYVVRDNRQHVWQQNLANNVYPWLLLSKVSSLVSSLHISHCWLWNDARYLSQFTFHNLKGTFWVWYIKKWGQKCMSLECCCMGLYIPLHLGSLLRKSHNFISSKAEQKVVWVP